jgi:hypothetical protein
MTTYAGLGIIVLAGTIEERQKKDKRGRSSILTRWERVGCGRVPLGTPRACAGRATHPPWVKSLQGSARPRSTEGRATPVRIGRGLGIIRLTRLPARFTLAVRT